MPRPRDRDAGLAVLATEGILLVLILILAAARLLGPEPPERVLTADEIRLQIDLNRADWPELVNLPGIGEARAREIVRDREARGPFSSARDLERVRGIGPATVEGLRLHLVVN